MARNFGGKIRDARKAAGLTQRQLAKAIGVGNTSISNWEQGVSSPDPETIELLGQILGVQPNYFFDQPQAAPTFDDFTFAMHNHSGDLTDEDKATILKLAAQLAEANRKKVDRGETD